MKLSQQVTSLEISQRLKELGVKQESLFYWSKQEDGRNWKIVYHSYFAIDKRKDYSAFTAAELGEMLPEQYVSGKVEQNEGYVCFDNDELFEPPYENRIAKYADTEADTRGKMLIYLLENKLIKL